MDALLHEKTSQKMSSYASRHSLYTIFQDMLSSALISKPDDPISFFIDFLKRPPVSCHIILGPPTLNLTELAEKISKAHETILISTNNLLKNAIARGNSLGMQAKPYVEANKPVPDKIVAGIVTSRLHDPDVINNGFILIGFPQTRQQAKILLQSGIIPSHVVIIECPDESIIEKSINGMVDPLSSLEYNSKYEPAPNPNIESRLTRNEFSDIETANELAFFKNHIGLISDCFNRDVIHKVSIPHAFTSLDIILSQVINVFGVGKRVYGPREFKICVNGLPASGKTMVSEMLSDLYGFVHGLFY